ncbi:hypothetical protein GCM10010513_54430 [Streptomyces glebosus]|nr:hypothetical protein GCM10010513_54430 [Streptomyces glebosus]
MVALAGRADDAGSPGDRDLDGERADTTRGGVHQNGLAERHPDPVECLIGRQSGEREPGGLLPVERRRLGCQVRTGAATSSAKVPCCTSSLRT